MAKTGMEGVSRNFDAIAGENGLMSMKHYLLCHGFGFTNDYWKNLIPMLDGHITFYGYDTVDHNLEYIGIGHSMGCIKLNNSGLKFSKLIFLEGILNYCGNGEKLRRAITPELNKIIDDFKLDPVKALKTSYQYSGYPEAIPEVVSQENLLLDLEMLKIAHAHCGAPTVVIGNENDTMVPPQLIKDNFQHIPGVEIKMLTLINNHTLGYHDVDAIINDIQF